ncbi:MAG: ATPase [Gracilibacter sp. BRH_c7a]|nr:MAG: ATPase [Gracilibacter sp. BRH_c7a]
MSTVFALDIGTRVVIGLVMQKTANGYEIKASSRTEHTQRAMYDGQVHDVNEVAAAVQRIKNDLEKKVNIELRKVAVAAAGRALCTETASVSRTEPLPINWERPDVLTLEMEAVQQAMKKISSAEIENDFFYCVGYSTVRQLLENQTITNLIGQRGKQAQLTVIATFLPRTVVDGLVAVLSRVGLEMESLTLEPIAAGQAAIPIDMRNLNIALVDIGAGTSDIALTKEGSFFSYGMVPMAGDEITEVICSHFLLSFQEGERVKRDLQDNLDVEMNNFFGEKVLVSKEEIIKIINPTVQTLADRICKEIVYLNNRSPQAVILVGGGSLTPLLCQTIAEKMNLPSNRVGIQERKRLINILGEDEHLEGPDVITPLGIAMTALDEQVLHYFSVEVNNAVIPIFELNLATVAEALLAAGIHPKAFIGRPGAALIYELNGEIKVLKGGLGSPAEIYVNGQTAKLDSHLRPGDSIRFIPGSDGKAAKAKVKDIIGLPQNKRIVFNNEEVIFKAVVMSEGKELCGEDEIEDNCRLTIIKNENLEDFLTVININPNDYKKRSIIINGQKQELEPKIKVWLNGEVIENSFTLQEGDTIDIKARSTTIKDLGLQAEPMNFIVNGQDFLLPPKENRVLYKGKQIGEDYAVEDDMELKVEGFLSKPILSDLLPYLNLTKEVSPHGRLEMLVNGKNAEFTTILNRGDRVVIIWIK